MKRSVFCLLTFCFSMLAVALFACTVLAQGTPPPPFDYRLEYAHLPPGATSLGIYGIQEVNGGIVVVGAYYVNGEGRGFVYDHQTGEFSDIVDLFQITSHDSSSCRSINANGIAVGRIQELGGNRRSYWFNWLSPSPTLHFLDEQFPDLAAFSSQNANDINVHGDIIVADHPSSGLSSYCVNPFANASYQLPLERPVAISDSGFVLSDDGRDPVTGEYIAARWSALSGKETFNLRIRTDWGALNELGQFGAMIDGGFTRGTPCRVANGIDWIGPNNEAYWVASVNGSGDLGYMQVVTTGPRNGRNRVDNEKAFFYHDELDQIYAINSLVEDSFLNNGQQLAFFLTERDMALPIPTPIIVGSVNDHQGDYRIYFLIPQPYEAPPVFTYTHNNQTPIPDPGTVTSTIIVADNYLIADLNITLNIDHNRASDLDVFLIAPDGMRVELFTDVGGNGDDFTGTTLDDQAGTSITQGSAPFTGNYRPEGNLSDFVGRNMSGTWTLEVTDDSSNGGQNASGTLLSWSFTVQTQ